MTGWMSPNFGPMGCIPAICFIIVIVAACFGMLYLVYTVVYP